MKKAHYDYYDYIDYWKGRDYEHESEVQVVSSILSALPRTNSLLDVGCGFGRLAPVYARFTKNLTLLDPSQKNLQDARKFLTKSGVVAKFACSSAHDMPFKDSSFDVVTMVRVMHHIPLPLQALGEINRVTKKGGYLLLEFANKLSAKTVLSSLIRLDFSILDRKPLERRSKENIEANSIPFVNHHPLEVARALREAGFTIIEQRSVSNVRSSFLKRNLPHTALVFVEKLLQASSKLTGILFGPSVFVLAKKK